MNLELEEATERFSNSVDRFKRLARTNSQRSLLREIYGLHGELQLTGNGLMGTAEELASNADAIEMGVADLVADLDENIKKIDHTSAAAPALLEGSYGIRGSLHEAAAATRHYRLSPTSQLRGDAIRAANEFTRYAATYDTLADSGDVHPWLASVRDRGGDVKTKVVDHFDLVDKNIRTLRSFRTGTVDLMARLTEELRPQIMQERAEVQRDVDRAVAEAQAVILTVAFAGLCLGAALALWSSVGIMRPLQEAVRKLNETSSKLAASSADRSAGATEQVASVAERWPR